MLNKLNPTDFFMRLGHIFNLFDKLNIFHLYLNYINSRLFHTRNRTKMISFKTIRIPAQSETFFTNQNRADLFSNRMNFIEPGHNVGLTLGNRAKSDNVPVRSGQDQTGRCGTVTNECIFYDFFGPASLKPRLPPKRMDARPFETHLKIYGLTITSRIDVDVWFLAIVSQCSGAQVKHKPPVQPIASFIGEIDFSVGAAEFFQIASTRPLVDPKMAVHDERLVQLLNTQLHVRSQVKRYILIYSVAVVTDRITFLSRRCILSKTWRSVNYLGIKKRIKQRNTFHVQFLTNDKKLIYPRSRCGRFLLLIIYLKKLRRTKQDTC